MTGYLVALACQAGLGTCLDGIALIRPPKAEFLCDQVAEQWTVTPCHSKPCVSIAVCWAGLTGYQPGCPGVTLDFSKDDNHSQ